MNFPHLILLCLKTSLITIGIIIIDDCKHHHHDHHDHHDHHQPNQCGPNSTAEADPGHHVYYVKVVSPCNNDNDWSVKDGANDIFYFRSFARRRQLAGSYLSLVSSIKSSSPPSSPLSPLPSSASSPPGSLSTSPISYSLSPSSLLALRGDNATRSS